MESPNKAGPAQVFNLDAYRFGKALALPVDRDGLLLHAFGPIIRANRAMGDLLEQNPARMRGLSGTVEKWCTPETQEIIKQHITDSEPARYEAEFINGKRVLITSCLVDWKGTACRLGRMQRLSHWI